MKRTKLDVPFEAFIEKMLALDEEKRYRIVTCGEEVHLAYNRVSTLSLLQLKYLLINRFVLGCPHRVFVSQTRTGLGWYLTFICSQHRSVEQLYLNTPAWYAQQDPDRFVFHVGEQVTSLDHAGRSVTTSKGRTIHVRAYRSRLVFILKITQYDICVLATGSEASLPPYVTPETTPRTRVGPVSFVYSRTALICISLGLICLSFYCGPRRYDSLLRTPRCLQGRRSGRRSARTRSCKGFIRYVSFLRQLVDVNLMFFSGLLSPT